MALSLSRKVRIVLAEKKLAFELVVEKPWEPRPDFLTLNPAGEVPVLVEPDGAILADSAAITEYLDEAYADPPLIGSDLWRGPRCAAWSPGST